MFDNARNAYLTGSAQPGIYGTNETGSAWPFNWNNHLVIQGRSDAARDILFVTGSSPALRYQITGTGEHNFMGRVAMSMNPASGGLSLRNGNDRWQFYLSGAETGSNNAGSSFSLAAYTDAGGFIDNPILIARASAGTMTLSRPVKISTNGTVSSQLDLNGSGGTSPGFSISRGASTRWVMLSEFGAEGGGNTGSDFSIRAYNDAGTAYDTPLSIARAPGGPVTFSRPVTFNSGLGTSGLVTASSGISIEGGTPGIGRITRNTANGLQMWLPSGTDYNFIMSAPGGQDLIYNRAGGTQVEFPASGGVSVAGPLQVTNFVGSNYTLSHNDFWKMYMSNGSNDAGALHIRTGDNGDEPIYFEQVNGETPNVRMVINGSGNVGIGTQDVGSFRARVAGDVRLGNVATIGRSGSHYDEFGFNVGFTNTSNQYTYVNTDPAASIRMGYQGSIEFRTAPQGTGGTSLSLNRRMVITEAGNVGIGTSGEPAAKLHVDGDAILSDWKFRQSMTPYNFSVGAVLHNKLYPGTYDYALGQFDHTGETVLNSPYKVSIGTKGTAYVKISESEVTIDHGVTVNGTLQANVLAAGTVKATAWEIAEVPDYVFEKGYKLASLEKVESFVKENKHLPEIPSAKEMKRDGLDLVKMNFDLLKKVEELTLYAIEQNKVTRAQERRSRDLEKEILELKKTLASMTKSGN